MNAVQSAFAVHFYFYFHFHFKNGRAAGRARRSRGRRTEADDDEKDDEGVGDGDDGGHERVDDAAERRRRPEDPEDAQRAGDLHARPGTGARRVHSGRG